MDCINEIKNRLKKYPELTWHQEGATISVSPQGGFTVWLSESENHLTVGYNEWHEEFTNPEGALNCFAFGLSNNCRLKVYSRGHTEYKWTMEAFENNSWVSYSSTALLLFPFWRKKKITYLQNNVITN